MMVRIPTSLHGDFLEITEDEFAIFEKMSEADRRAWMNSGADPRNLKAGHYGYVEDDFREALGPLTSEQKKAVDRFIKLFRELMKERNHWRAECIRKWN